MLIASAASPLFIGEEIVVPHRVYGVFPFALGACQNERPLRFSREAQLVGLFPVGLSVLSGDDLRNASDNWINRRFNSSHSLRPSEWDPFSSAMSS